MSAVYPRDNPGHYWAAWARFASENGQLINVKVGRHIYKRCAVEIDGADVIYLKLFQEKGTGSWMRVQVRRTIIKPFKG